MEYYACAKFLDDKLKYYFVPISSVFSKKNDTDYIQPVDLEDFDKNKNYYILWNDEHKYPGYIVCLESEEDARSKALVKPKRLIIRRKFTSSETSDQENEEDTEKSVPNRKIKLFKSFSQKENSQRIVTAYKKKILMDNCKELNECTNNSNTNNYVMENVQIQLKNCLDAPRSEEQSILKNISNDSLSMLTAKNKNSVQKARKSFPRPPSVMQAAVASTSKDIPQCSQPQTTPSLPLQISAASLNLNNAEALYDDYLMEHRRYQNLTNTEKDRMIKDSTEVLQL